MVPSSISGLSRGVVTGVAIDGSDEDRHAGRGFSPHPKMRRFFLKYEDDFAGDLSYPIVTADAESN